MKLLEKLARDAFSHAYNYGDPPTSEESYEAGYLAGFLKARQMAQTYYHERSMLHSTAMQQSGVVSRQPWIDFSKLGEEESDG